MGLRKWLARRIGRGIAKTQLRSFEMLRKAAPEKSNDEIFRSILALRFGWSRERVDDLLSEEGRDSSLLNFIEGVISYEYRHKLPMEDLAHAHLGARDYLKKTQKLLYAKRDGLS